MENNYVRQMWSIWLKGQDHSAYVDIKNSEFGQLEVS